MKGSEFLSFAKNMGKHLSNKYGTKRLDSAKKSIADAIKAASRKAIQKTAEATGDLIGNKIADKITSKAKKSNKQEVDTPKEIYISPEKRQKIIDDLRLILEQNLEENLEQKIGCILS